MIKNVLNINTTLSAHGALRFPHNEFSYCRKTGQIIQIVDDRHVWELIQEHVWFMRRGSKVRGGVWVLTKAGCCLRTHSHMFSSLPSFYELWLCCIVQCVFFWATTCKFLSCVFRRVSLMLLVPEAWGEASQSQAPMGRPVSQHALLLLQCMLVLRPGGVASRRGPVLLPESPCQKTEHPVVPHSGQCLQKHMRRNGLFDPIH